MLYVLLLQSAATQSPASGWLVALISWAPIIVLIVLWWLLVRRMGYFSKRGGYVKRSEEHMDRVEQTLSKIEEHLRKIAERSDSP